MLALSTAQEALARGDWEAARDGFMQAGDVPAALEGLSWAAFWLGDEKLTLGARERAFHAHRAAGDVCGAARMAMWLASDHLEFRGDDVLAQGWLERAQRLLGGVEECVEHGWLCLLKADVGQGERGDPAAVCALAREAQRIGRESGALDVETVALALEGKALVWRGEVADGMRRLSEASALASTEEFELPITAGWAMCCAISAGEGVGELARAVRWSQVMRSYAERWGGRNMMGICRSAYGGVLATRGDWAGAETELTAAVEDLEASRPGLAASGLIRLAELRARQGRSAEARGLFERAVARPAATIGLGRLALADGDAAAACSAAERVLRRVPASAVLERLPAQELHVRALIALGRTEDAAAAARELERTVERLGTPYLRGRGHTVAAELAAARGDHETARREAEEAVDRLAEASAPHEGALARLVLARVLEALGHADAAASEAAAARDALAALGATADVAAADAQAGTAELTDRELDVLRLVAQGLSDAEIAERLVLSPHTVHRHVANVRTKLRLPSRSAAVAYAARAGLL